MRSFTSKSIKPKSTRSIPKSREFIYLKNTQNHKNQVPKKIKNYKWLDPSIWYVGNPFKFFSSATAIQINPNCPLNDTSNFNISNQKVFPNA